MNSPESRVLDSVALPRQQWKKAWRCLVRGCLGVVALPTFGNEDSARLAAVLTANPPRDEVVCSYTSTTTDSENPDDVFTVRHVADEASTADAPSGSLQLLAVNGERPSAEALAEFEAETEERPRGAEPVVFDLPEEIFGSMRLAEEDANTLTFAFEPDFGADEAEMEGKMRGLLVVGKPDLRPRRMTIVLTEPFSPAPTVKVSEFRQEMAFVLEPATNATVMSEMAMTVRGRALVFKKVENDVRVTFGDFDCHDAAAATNP